MTEVTNLDHRRLADKTRAAGKPAVVPTPTLANITRMLTTVYNNPELGIGVVVGASGMGKTTAARAFVERHNAVLCTMSEVAGQARNGLLYVYEAMGAGETLRQCRAVEKAVLHRIRLMQSRHFEDRRVLIVVDEAQNMTPPVIEELCCIWDATQVGMVFMGNAAFLGKSAPASYQQLVSRLGPRLDIADPDPNDVPVWCHYNGVHGARQVRRLTELANLCAGLRTVAKVIGLARDNSGGDDAVIEVDHIEAAVEMLGLVKLFKNVAR